MATKYLDTGDGCPYDLASGRVAECPRFEPLVVFDRSDGPVVGCAHVHSAIAEPGLNGGTDRFFYARCMLRTGDPESARAFVVPLD